MSGSESGLGQKPKKGTGHRRQISYQEYASPVYQPEASILTPEMMEQYDRYKKVDAWKIRDGVMRLMLAIIFAILLAIGALIYLLDCSILPGIRFVPAVLGILLVSHIVWLWGYCRWKVWQANKKGINLVLREPFKIGAVEEIAKIKQLLKDCNDAHNDGRRKRIIMCTASSGGGHEATTRGLKELLAEVNFPADVEECPMAFMVETNPGNPLMQAFGVTGEQIYNWGLLQGQQMAWFITLLTSIAQKTAIRLDRVMHNTFQRLLGWDHGDVPGKVCEQLWLHYRPDLILDFTTGTHGFMYRGLKRAGMEHVPIVVCISDFEGVGVHAWIEDIRQYAICGTSTSYRQAEEFGLPAAQRFQTSGMVLRPSFYQPSAGGADERRAAELEKMGLDPSVRTALVCWGGLGSASVIEVGKATAVSRRRVNIIFLCGRNDALASALENHDWGEVRVLIQGFTTRVPYFMQISDFCICKPGPGVCSEAALLGLPMIVEWNAFTLPQEVAVGRWVLDRGLGLGFSKISEISACVERMCELFGTDMRQRLTPRPSVPEGKRLAGIDVKPSGNRAVFEIPMILNQILRTHFYVPASEMHETGVGKSR